MPKLNLKKRFPQNTSSVSVKCSKSTGALAASGVVLAEDGLLTSLQVFTDGTNAATVTIYDNPTAASGTILSKISVPGATLYDSFVPTISIDATTGIYASIAGTGASMIVHYMD